MTWTPEQLAKVKRLQAAAHARDPGFGQRALDALNAATLEAKSKMTPEAIAREEESRRNHVFDPLTGLRRDTTGSSSP